MSANFRVRLQLLWKLVRPEASLFRFSPHTWGQWVATGRGGCCLPLSRSLNHLTFIRRMKRTEVIQLETQAVLECSVNRRTVSSSRYTLHPHRNVFSFVLSVFLLKCSFWKRGWHSASYRFLVGEGEAAVTLPSGTSSRPLALRSSPAAGCGSASVSARARSRKAVWGMADMSLLPLDTESIKALRNASRQQ